jgi:hypothetical protein
MPSAPGRPHSGFTAWDVLCTWSAIQDAPPLPRATCLLRLTETAPGGSDPGLLPIADRDRRLLALYAELFGTEVEASATCPRCQEETQFRFSAQTLLEQPRGTGPGPLRWQHSTLRLRMPTSDDLGRALELPPARRRRQLAADCVIDAPAALPQDPQRWPEDLVQAIAEQLAAADPVADIEFVLRCPECEHRWRIMFDIVDFLFREITGWIPQLLSDVQVLAASFGWDEEAILRLPDWRRQRYVEALGA